MSALSFEQNRRETTTRLAALILANAFIFQQRLAKVETRIKPITTLLLEKNFIETTILHWKSIIEDIIYVPILKMAYDILSAFPIRPETETSVRNLAITSSGVVLEKASLQHDLMVKLYRLSLVEGHLSKGRETSLPAATLLMKLALDSDRWPRIDWSSEQSLTHLRIADLACGTGTMLMAASQSLNDNFIKASNANGQPIDSVSLIRAQQIIIEKIIHGFDVSPSAIHLTASTLALLAPEICARKMQLYCLPLGKLPSGQINLGSLEYMAADKIPAQPDFVSPGMGRATHVAESEVNSAAALPPLDVCVMNPPFFWNIGKNPSSSPADNSDNVMRAELSRRIRGANLAASASAGPGSVFVAVADRHIKDGGRIALVLPAAAMTGVGWERTRDLIDNGYILEMVIASHDPDHLSFSEDTDVKEVLLIAKKRDRRDNPHTEAFQTRTKFVSLWINPRTTAQAAAVAEQISRNSAGFRTNTNLPAHDASPDTADIMVGSSKYGEMIDIPSQEANPAQWIGTAFAHTDLVRIAWMLRQGSVSLTKGCAPVSIPMTTIGAIGLLGPDRRDMTDTFGRAKTATQYPAFRLQSTDKIGTIEAKPNEWLQPHIVAVRGRKVRDAALIWRRAGPIMIPERSQVDTQRTLALRLPCPALSQGWWPLRLRQQNDRAEKALVLWLNSTLGILTLLAHRVPTRGAWMQFKRQTIQSMPTLDVTALSEPHIERLARTYDSIAQRELQRFADLANDDVRAEIDNVFSDVLGLIGIDAIRAELSREPIIGLKPCSEQKISDDTDDRLEFELL